MYFGRHNFHNKSQTDNGFVKSRLSSLKHCDVYGESRVQNDTKSIKGDQKIMSILSPTSIVVKLRDGYSHHYSSMSTPCILW